MQSLFYNKNTLILASASPRRQLFLEELGVAFSVVQPHGIEPLPEQGEAPCQYAQRAASVKAQFVAQRNAGSTIIAADTVVALYDEHGRGEIFGKPRDKNHALTMLKALSGRSHQVISAVSLILPWGEEVLFHESTHVHFHDWPEEILSKYAQCGEPADKAGAYAIQGQGAFLVERIEGSWSNVVGLPVTALVHKLLEHKIIAPMA